MVWTEKQLTDLQVAERVASGLSLLGCAFILITYCSSSAFRKPIRSLIFCASFGNILSTVATLISRQGVMAGKNSVLCQLQAFFIQQWMPADSLWSFCMALNVYFAFKKRYSSVELKRLEWKYFAACYGLPLIPSVTLLCIKTKTKGRIYGPALIWCSIDQQWQYLRLVCFYGPVWLVIIATFTIYIIVGRDIFQTRQTLRNIAEEELYNFHPALDLRKTSKTTMIEVTSDVMAINKLQPWGESAANDTIRPESQFAPYSIHIESAEQSQRRKKSATELNTNAVALSYLRCSFLFFIALVVTWIPSSINRIYSLIYPEANNFALNFVGSVVLPLQGFWNAIIYLSTSLPIFEELWSSHVTNRLWRDRTPAVQTVWLHDRRHIGPSNTGSAASLVRRASERS